MLGKVIGFVRKSGMFITENDDGSYSIIEPLCAFSAEVGDTIKGNLRSVAGEILRNVSKSKDIPVYIQDFDVSRDLAFSMLR